MSNQYPLPLILRAVCFELEIDDARITAGEQTRPVVEARHLCCYIARNHGLDRDWTSIAKAYGLKQGSTAKTAYASALQAIRNVEGLQTLMIMIGETLQALAEDSADR